MKIKPEHSAHIQQQIVAKLEALGAEKISVYKNQLANNPKVHDLEKRFRWDVCYAAGLSQWLSDNIYSYANDDHIDTVLRSITELKITQK